jgi:hypothetical protein
VLVCLLAGLRRERAAAALREPLLDDTLVAGLEFLPFVGVGGLDPDGPESRVNGGVGESCQVIELTGGCARPHRGELRRGRLPFPEPLSEQHQATGRDQFAQLSQRGHDVAGRCRVAHGVARAKTQDQVRGSSRGLHRRFLDEYDALAQAAGGCVTPTPGQVIGVEIDAEAGRGRRGRKDAEHEFTPPAPDVKHGSRAPGREPGDEPSRPGL